MPATKPDPTRNTRAARYRAASKTAGGAHVSTPISAEAAQALAIIRDRDKATIRAAIEQALLDSSRRFVI